MVSQHGGNGWSKEEPPHGVAPLEACHQALWRFGQVKADPVVALASSHGWCEVMQVSPGDHVCLELH